MTPVKTKQGIAYNDTGIGDDSLDGSTLFPPTAPGPTFSASISVGTAVLEDNPGQFKFYQNSNQLVEGVYYGNDTNNEAQGATNDPSVWVYPLTINLTAYQYSPYPCRNIFTLKIKDQFTFKNTGTVQHTETQLMVTYLKGSGAVTIPLKVFGPLNGDTPAFVCNQQLIIQTEDHEIYYTAPQNTINLTFNWPS